MEKFGLLKKMCVIFLVCGAAAIASPAQGFTTLHSFDSTDGANPEAGLIQATDGNFYGTTSGGWPYSNGGTIFKITSGGTLTTLYSFCAQTGCADGNYPEGGLIQATDGNFYGTTFAGGAYGKGTVFEVAPTGALTTLHRFRGTDGAHPWAGLIQANDGNFYGTTYAGGGGKGTVFEITPAGTLTRLYSFCSQANCTDGAPEAGLVQATDGNFYGTTYFGGVYNDGTVFTFGPATVKLSLTKLNFGNQVINTTTQPRR
jgi:uncharacterized repeat protein (TIGR03803 family)